jgi:hypothetical protein
MGATVRLIRARIKPMGASIRVTRVGIEHMVVPVGLTRCSMKQTDTPLCGTGARICRSREAMSPTGARVVLTDAQVRGTRVGNRVIPTRVRPLGARVARNDVGACLARATPRWIPLRFARTRRRVRRAGRAARDIVTGLGLIRPRVRLAEVDKRTARGRIGPRGARVGVSVRPPFGIWCSTRRRASSCGSRTLARVGRSSGRVGAAKATTYADAYPSRREERWLCVNVKVLPSVSSHRTMTTPGATSTGDETMQPPARSTSARAVVRSLTAKCRPTLLAMCSEQSEPDADSRDKQR